MNLSASLSKLFLTAVVACLFTGCSPSDSKNAPTPIANENGNRESSAKEIIGQDDSATKNAADKIPKEPSEPEIADDPAEALNTPPTKPEIVNDPAFHQALVAASNHYLEYGMVNTAALTAPADCARAPAPEDLAAQPQLSQSEDKTTHGTKLYYLFAKEVAHYLNQDGSPTPVGQVLVKESWTSKPSNPNARNLRNHASGNRINPRTKIGTEMLEIGQRKALFVMLKLATDTPGTDQGWVYGVVDPESKQVTESGRVPSCIRCHRDAKHDRLFGPANLSL